VRPDDDVKMKMVDRDNVGIVDLPYKRAASSMIARDDGGARYAGAMLVDQMIFHIIHRLN
jgi:hypothetical protein